MLAFGDRRVHTLPVTDTIIKDPHTVVQGKWRVGMSVRHSLGFFCVEAIDVRDLHVQLCVVDDLGRGMKDYAFLFEPATAGSEA